MGLEWLAEHTATDRRCRLGFRALSVRSMALLHRQSAYFTGGNLAL